MNRTQKTCIVLAIAMFISFIGTPAQANDDVKKINSANQALIDGKLDEALAQYDSVAETMPGNPLLAYNRGVALYRQGHVDQARQAFVKALDSDDPEMAAKASFNLGNCHYAAAVQQAETEPTVAIDSLQTAIAHYRNALQSNPADTDSRSNIELAHRLIKQLQQKEAQQQEEQQQQEQQPQQDSSQSEQDQSDQSESQDNESGKQDSDESKSESAESKSEENKSDESSSQPDDNQPNDSDDSSSEQAEAGKNESDPSNSGDPSDDENQSEEKSDGSKADQSEQESTEDPNAAGSENKDQPQQPEQQQSGQPSEQPQSEEQENDQEAQPQPGQEQQENQDQPEPGQQMSAGNADQQGQPEDGQQTTGYGVSQSGEPGDSIDKEEAMKMLQAIRDRDLMRRTQKLNETRRRYRPVDRDW